MANACERPYLTHELGWIARGLTLELAVAVLLYALHPWWPRIIRRPGSSVGSARWWSVDRVRLSLRSPKIRLTGPENADVLAVLEEVSRKAGLSRTPLWLVDPYAGTAGGRAYGLPGRPRVCIDMGLLPAALLAAGIRTLAARRRRGSDTAPDAARAEVPRPRPRRLAATLAVLAMLPLAAAAAGVPQDLRIWRPAAPAAAPRPDSNSHRGPSTTVSPASGSAVTTNDPRQRVRVGESRLWLTGEGGTWTFRRDGTLSIDYGTAARETGTLRGRLVVLQAGGSVTAHYRTADAVLGYSGSAVRRPGELTLRVAGAYVMREKLPATFTPDHYSCTGRTTRLSPPSQTDFPYELTLVRQPPEGG
ncbi:hypothetical protein [Streptomyces sp. NPDC001759]